MRTMAACGIIAGLVAVTILLANGTSFTTASDSKTATAQGQSVLELQEQIDVKSLPVLEAPDTI